MCRYNVGSVETGCTQYCFGVLRRAVVLCFSLKMMCILVIMNVIVCWRIQHMILFYMILFYNDFLPLIVVELIQATITANII